MSAGSSNYRNGIRSATRGLWTGVLDYYQFFDVMVTTIQTGIPRAWEEGAAECGISPDELTLEEKMQQQAAIYGELAYVDGFAIAIEAGSKANGGKLGPLMGRADLWVNRYRDVVNRAKLMACADQKLVWILGPTKDHCNDCLNMNGRVYRGSIWDKYDVRPQSPRLECGGYRCLCNLVPTEARANPGRPPGLRG